MQDGDAVIVFNFRADRVVEISKALEYEKFDKFERKCFPKVILASASGFYLLPMPAMHSSDLHISPGHYALAFMTLLCLQMNFAGMMQYDGGPSSLLLPNSLTKCPLSVTHPTA